MGYVEHLLRNKLAQNYNYLRDYQSLGQTEDVDSCLKVISELEYILTLISEDKTAKKY